MGSVIYSLYTHLYIAGEFGLSNKQWFFSPSISLVLFPLIFDAILTVRNNSHPILGFLTFLTKNLQKGLMALY